MRNFRLAAVPVVMLLILAACQGGGTTGSGSGKGTIKIGVDFPLSGNEVANGEPTLNGVKLAVKEANAKGGVGGYTVELNIQDDAVAGVHNPDQGATNAGTLVADQAVAGHP